jgi:DNA helicase II / ATP-dependent DNA helicase PcrA
VGNPTLYPYKERIDKCFSRVFIDEVQDLGGDDIDWLLSLVECKANVFAVGDYYQGTFQTSQRGNKNKKSEQDIQLYKNKFEQAGFKFDTTTLNKSYRCSIGACKFVKDNLGIEMYSANEGGLDEEPGLIQDETEIGKIWYDNSILGG